MGKGKGRGDEHACRVNYLFQAGELVAGAAPQLSQYYGNVLTVITEKTAPKKDFTMKRLMCKRCQSILKVGENARYRLIKNKRHRGTPNVVLTCLFCGLVKTLPTRRNFRINAEVNGKIVHSCGNNGNGNGNGGIVVVAGSSGRSAPKTRETTTASTSTSTATVLQNEMITAEPEQVEIMEHEHSEPVRKLLREEDMTSPSDSPSSEPQEGTLNE